MGLNSTVNNGLWMNERANTHIHTTSIIKVQNERVETKMVFDAKKKYEEETKIKALAVVVHPMPIAQCIGREASMKMRKSTT